MMYSLAFVYSCVPFLHRLREVLKIQGDLLKKHTQPYTRGKLYTGCVVRNQKQLWLLDSKSLAQIRKFLLLQEIE